MVYKNMNKLEREVSSLSFGEFDKLSQEDMDWVESNSMKYFPLERRNYSENGRFRGVLAAYFVFYQRIGDWQVIRFIMARERYNQPISYFEPIRYWLNREGEYVLEMKRRNGMLYCDSWAEDSELEIRRTQNVQLLYLAWTDKFFKVKSLIPELERDNYKEPYGSPLMYTRELLTDGHLEMLHRMELPFLANKYYNLSDNEREDYWTAIRIALRHRYPLKKREDVDMWWDMIKMEKRVGVDLHNPHFVAPDNLKQMHDAFVTRERNVMDRRNREAQIKRENEKYNRVKRGENTYKKSKAKWLGINFSNDLFDAHVLQSIEEFKDEGIKMCHCVFSCEYYKRKDSVILSIRDKKGKRIETAEVNIKKFYIAQQYGKHDVFSEWHEDIKNFINDNMWRFKQASMERRAV
jgi:hypothetical protein